MWPSGLAAAGAPVPRSGIARLVAVRGPGAWESRQGTGRLRRYILHKARYRYDAGTLPESATGEKTMHPDPPCCRTIGQLRQDLTQGVTSAVDLCQSYADRIAAATPDGSGLNAVLGLNPALQAQARDLDVLQTDSGMPLAGMPILIKDNILTEGPVPTTCGSLALQHWVPGADAPVVQGLRRAGALILGKANLSEWANFRSTSSSSGWSSVGGQTRNPHVLNRDPSGSSSGSAVAVSAGLCAAAVGTETDGSICAPASRNGVVGVKPTVGLVSRTGIIPISHRQDTAGPMTRSVRDAALMLSAMAGPDPTDPVTQDIPDDFMCHLDQHLGASGLAGIRIGMLALPDWTFSAVAPLYHAAADLLRELGSDLQAGLQMTGPNWGQQEKLALKTEFKAGLNAFFQVQAAIPPVRSLAELIEFNQVHADRIMPIFGQELLLQAQATDPEDPRYAQAVADLARLSQDEGLLKLLDGHRLDLIVAPTANPAAVVDHVWGSRGGASFCSPAAVAGYPHVTVPMGTVRHLPVGLSFVGRPFSEPLLLQVADCFERALDLVLAPQFIPSLET